MSRDRQKCLLESLILLARICPSKNSFSSTIPPPFCSLLLVMQSCSASQSRTYQKRDPLKSATRPEEPLPAPNLPSYSSRGGIQGLSKATPFRFQPSPRVPHPSVPPLLPNTHPLYQLLANCHLKHVQVSPILNTQARNLAESMTSFLC